MARTIVYESEVRQQQNPRTNENQRVSAGGDGQTPDTTQKADKFPDKLAKYIPAEALAFFIPFSTAGQDKSLLVTALIVGCVATPVYLYIMAFRNNPTQMPRLYFYILAGVAFLAWAQATSDVGLMIGLSKTWSSFILTAGVLLIPAIDELISVIEKKRKTS